MQNKNKRVFKFVLTGGSCGMITLLEYHVQHCLIK